MSFTAPSEGFYDWVYGGFYDGVYGGFYGGVYGGFKGRSNEFYGA